MIKISQIKVSLDKICQKAPAELVKKGIIGEEEKQLVRRAAAKMCDCKGISEKSKVVIV